MKTIIPALVIPILAASTLLALEPIATTANSNTPTNHYATSSWKTTEVSGVKYRWGGGSNNILYIFNETGDWKRIDYDDGTGWRYVLLKKGENSEPLADKNASGGTVRFRNAD